MVSGLESEIDEWAALNKFALLKEHYDAAAKAEKIKAQKEREKKTFANMFDRFTEIDKKKEEIEKRRNARPDAMNQIDEWEG